MTTETKTPDVLDAEPETSATDRTGPKDPKPRRKRTRRTIPKGETPETPAETTEALTIAQPPASALAIQNHGRDVMALMLDAAETLGPNIDALKEFIGLQERIFDRNARSAFEAAYVQMQAELPEIDERGSIKNKSGAVQSKYSYYEDIQRAVRPILRKWGFSLRCDSKTVDREKGVVLVTGHLTHIEGHSVTTEFESKPDMSGNKNDVQALGSIRAYGHRYCAIDLLDIVTAGTDKDGQRPGEGPEPKAKPHGYDEWETDILSCADNGMEELRKAWESGGAKKPYSDYRDFLMTEKGELWEQTKVTAMEVDKQREAAEKGAS